MNRPDYAAGTLADVLPGVLTALGLPGYPDRLGLAAPLADVRQVAVLLVDGMGWRQLPLLAPHAPAIAQLAANARSTTCGFPSTTPTSLVSLTTGALPGAHGVLAFTSWIPGTDRVLNYALWADDPPPLSWQPVPPLFLAAAAAGLAATVVNRPEYAGSGLTTVTCRGADYVGAATADELAAGMLAALGGSSSAQLVYGYLPDLDKAGHEYGLDSGPWRQAAADVDRLVARLVQDLPPGAALVVTSDHGQLNVPADQRIDIDADPRLRAGVRLAAGEPRVRYLHTEPGAVADVVAAWRELAGHAAWVCSREEIISSGLYGPMHRDFAERVGDVAVVCHDGWAVLSSRADPPGVQRLVAMHGALTPAELEIPLLIAR